MTMAMLPLRSGRRDSGAQSSIQLRRRKRWRPPSAKQPSPAEGQPQAGKSQPGQSHECPDCQRPPCAGQGSPSRLFHRRGHHLSGAIQHDVQQAEHWQYPRKTKRLSGARYRLAPAISKDRQRTFIAQKIGANRPAICSQRSPDQAQIR